LPCLVHPHSFRVSVVVVCICIGTATIKHLLMCRDEENAPNSNMCACVLAKSQKKMAVFLLTCVCLCVFGGWQFPI